MRRLKRSLTLPADLDRLNSDGFSQLHVAIRNGEVSEVQRLLAAGADVDCKTAQLLAPRKTPLVLAVETNRREVLPFLLAAGAQPLGSLNFWRPSALYLAANKGDTASIELILDSVKEEWERLLSSRSAGGQRKHRSKLAAEVQRFFILLQTHGLKHDHRSAQDSGCLVEGDCLRWLEEFRPEEEKRLVERLGCMERALIELFKAGAPVDAEIKGILPVDWALNLNMMKLAMYLIRSDVAANASEDVCAAVSGQPADFAGLDSHTKCSEVKLFSGRCELCLPSLGLALCNEDPVGMLKKMRDDDCRLMVGVRPGEHLSVTSAAWCAQTLMLVVRLSSDSTFLQADDVLRLVLDALTFEGANLKGLKHVVRALCDQRRVMHSMMSFLTTASVCVLDEGIEKCLVALFVAGAKPAIDCCNVSGQSMNIMLMACEAVMPKLVACLAERGAATTIRRSAVVGTTRLRVLSRKVDVIGLLLMRMPSWFAGRSKPFTRVVTLYRQTISALLDNGAEFNPYSKVPTHTSTHVWNDDHIDLLSLMQIHIALLTDPHLLICFLKSGANLHHPQVLAFLHPLTLALRHSITDRSFAVVLTLLLSGFNPIIHLDRAFLEMALRDTPQKKIFSLATLLAASGIDRDILFNEEVVQRLDEKDHDLLSGVWSLKAGSAVAVRRSLFAPLPAVMKNLPIPRTLKRYVLCDVLADTYPLDENIVRRCCQIWAVISAALGKDGFEQADV